MIPFFVVALGIFLLSETLIFLTECAAILVGYHMYTDEGSNVAIVIKNRVRLEGCWLEHVPKLRYLRVVTTPLTLALLATRLYAILLVV